MGSKNSKNKNNKSNNKQNNQNNQDKLNKTNKPNEKNYQNLQKPNVQNMENVQNIENTQNIENIQNNQNNKDYNIEIIYSKDEKITLNVKESDTIKDIKKKIYENMNIIPHILIYNKIGLNHNKTLRDYNIKEGSCIKIKSIFHLNLHIFYLHNKYILLPNILTRDSIESIKRKIETIINIPISDQKLYYKEQELEDDKPLLLYDINNGAFEEKFDLYIGPSNGVSIHIKKNDEMYNFSFSPKEKVEKIKETIHTYLKYPTNVQTLAFNEEELDNDKTLEEYNINNKSTLTLFFKHKNDYLIFVKRPNGDIYAFDVVKSETILNIKKKVEEKEKDLTPEHLKLKFNNTELDENKTLLDYNVENESIIEAIFKSTDGYEIFIKTLTGKTLIFKVESYYTIEKVKELTYDSEHIPLDKQIIIFEGRQLEDYRTLEEYKVFKNSTLHYVLKLRGG